MPVNIIHADAIAGMTPAAILEFLAGKAQNCQRIAEIGCWRGRSTRALADNTKGHVWAIDTFRGSPELEPDIETMTRITGNPDWLYSEFYSNTRDLNNLTIIRKCSIEAAADFPDRYFDLIWLDGNHEYEAVIADIRAWYPKLASNGMLIGDDFQHPGVMRAVRECFRIDPGQNACTRLWGAPA